MKSIVFVCLGNICRSPSPNSIKVCKTNSVDISKYKASQFIKADINVYDLVVALDDSNYSDLEELGVTNLVKLGKYGYNAEDVPDPYFFNGFEGFEKVYKMIDTCVTNLFNEEKILN